MALTIDGVTKQFGSFTAIHDLSFSVTPGRIFGFLGTNGSGKTTTMRMILDIIRPTQGEITWDGRPNTEIPRRDFGYLPEERGLYPKMQVEDQLLFLAQLYGAESSRVKAELDSWFEQLDIEENRNREVDQLSKGNQQKIQFLAAILHDPEILILDEPFSGLDPVNAEQMRDAFLTMRDRGKTIIFSTHQLDDAQDLSDDVVIIHRGRLVASGDVLSVRQSTGQHVLRFAIANDECVEWLQHFPDVRVARRRQDHLELVVPNEDAAREVLAEALRRDAPVTRFDISYPSLNDVFLSKVRTMPEDSDGTLVSEEQDRTPVSV